MRRLALSMLLLLLVPASASAGGWATAEILSGGPPANPRAGDPWVMDIRVLQHGVTPAEGLAPTVTIAGDGGTRTFTGAAGREPGVYRVRVVFPAAGDWRWSIDNDFGGRMDMEPVRVAPAAPAAGGGSADNAKWWALGVGGAAVLLVCTVAAVALWRDRRPGLAPPPTAA